MKTKSQEIAEKWYAGKPVSLVDLSLIEKCDMRLDHEPESWHGKIHSLEDLESRIYYEKQEDGSLYLILKLAYEYPIEAKRINTEVKLLWWIRHLSEKNWMTADSIAILFDVVSKKNGFKDKNP